jgi:hypothetical protein
MARILGVPKFRAVDSNGNALSGGKVYVYVVGTTTTKNSYPTITDAIAGTNANANPVVLDSRGEADIVINGVSKIVLKTSTGTTIWTVERVEDYSDVYDNNGNELLIFNPVSSAVNYIEVANSATGNPVSLTAKGDDTNIALHVIPKGTGVVGIDKITARTTNSDLTLLPNGTGKISLSGLKWPTADGSNGHALKTNGSGTLSFGAVTASAGGSNTQIQYNSTGSVAGDTGFTTDGAGSVNISGDLDVDNLNLNGNTIISTNANGDINVTPNGTGKFVPSGGVAFSAYVGSSFNVSASTITTVQYNTEIYDSHGYFDSSTNYAFTPLVAGYYQINGAVTSSGALVDGAVWQLALTKNGTSVFADARDCMGVSGIGHIACSGLVYLNGSTDYVQGKIFHTDSGTEAVLNSTSCSFSGFLVTKA